MDQPTLIFIHIPKTGGSTLGIVIGRQYPKRLIWRFKPHQRDALMEVFKNLPEKERQSYRMLKGHVPYGMHEFTGRPATYITFLRDPVEQIASVYYYAVRRPSSVIYRELTDKQMSLEDFARSDLAGLWVNRQTRLVCGSAVPDALDPARPVTPEMLATARANIERDFAIVGLTERFDESLLLMQRCFGWKDVTYARQRVSRARPRGKDLPAAAVEAIRARWALDAELYEFGRAKFEEQLKTYSPVTEEELVAYREANRRFTSYWSAVQEPLKNLRGRGRRFRDRYLPFLKRR